MRASNSSSALQQPCSTPTPRWQYVVSGTVMTQPSHRLQHTHTCCQQASVTDNKHQESVGFLLWQCYWQSMPTVGQSGNTMGQTGDALQAGGVDNHAECYVREASSNLTTTMQANQACAISPAHRQRWLRDSRLTHAQHKQPSTMTSRGCGKHPRKP